VDTLETYEIAEQDYINGMKYKDIADKHGVSINTVKSWKTRYGWIRNGKSDNGKKLEKMCAHKNAKSVHTKSEPEEDAGELSEREQLFCVYYLKNFNAVKSYMKVYECTYESAAVSAHRMLKNAKIKNYLAKLQEERVEKLMLREPDIIQKYADIAFADMNEFMVKDENGDYQPAEQIDGSIVQEIKKGKFGTTIKLNDRMKALDKLENYVSKMREKEESDSYVGGIYLMDRMEAPEENERNTMEATAEASRVSGTLGG
jgi:phage terminase small subunit